MDHEVFPYRAEVLIIGGGLSGNLSFLPGVSLPFISKIIRSIMIFFLISRFFRYKKSSVARIIDCLLVERAIPRWRLQSCRRRVQWQVSMVHDRARTVRWESIGWDLKRNLSGVAFWQGVLNTQKDKFCTVSLPSIDWKWPYTIKRANKTVYFSGFLRHLRCFPLVHSLSSSLNQNTARWVNSLQNSWDIRASICEYSVSIPLIYFCFHSLQFFNFSMFMELWICLLFVIDRARLLRTFFR